MPLPDYQERVTLLQKGLARAYAHNPMVLNIPGQSWACKIDPNYYVAVQPFFDTELARAAGMFPSAVIESLVKTGNIISCPPARLHQHDIALVYNNSVLTLPVSFVDALFIDQALVRYGSLPAGLQVADLRISESSREAVELLFEGKTPPADVAFAPSGLRDSA